MYLTRTLTCLCLLAPFARGQVIGIDDLDPLSGTTNTIPWNQTGGYTSLHVYSAATLYSLGVCTGSVLRDLAIAPSNGNAGVFFAPQARLEIGHLSVSPPVPGAWTSHLANPMVVHALAMGPYTFPWTFGVYTSLPGFATAGFVWDGVRDVGIFVTTSAGTTGTFEARRTSTQRRHGVTVFNAVGQLPTTNGLLAMEVRMSWAAGPNCATSTPYGAGCYDGAYTFYEVFPDLPVFDFVGGVGTEQVLRATNIGTPGYSVGAGSTAWYTPTGSQVLNNAASPAVMADNTFSQALSLPFAFPFPGGSTMVMHAASNGYVLLAPTTSNASDSTPTAVELVSQQPILCPLWCDLHPGTNVPNNPQSGIYFDVAPGNQTVYVTWLDVADRRGLVPVAGATSVNVQLAMHASGDCEFRYGAIAPGMSAGFVLTGWSQGSSGGSSARDPGAIDLSAAIPFSTNGPDSTALALSVGLPRLGTSSAFTVSNVPDLVPLAILFVGDLQLPPVSLGFLGAPGCFAHSNANLTSATIGVALPLGTGSVSLAIPNDPMLLGASATTQAVAFTLSNALNLVMSNGVAWTIGY